MWSRASFQRIKGAGVAALLGLAGLLAPGGARAEPPRPWLFGGADLFNTHAMLSPVSNINSPTQINPRTASKLKLKWSLVTSGAITATPTVEEDALYVPDTAGSLYKINPDTGDVIWRHHMTEYTKFWGSQSRSSPAIADDVIVVGDYWAHDKAHTADTGALVLAVRKDTGALVWKTVVDKTNEWSEILGSPIVYNNKVYVGTASWEEAHTNDPNYVTTFRGSIVCLDLKTGKILWQRMLAPPGYSGVAAPGTTPVVWPARKALLVTTGNNYRVPRDVGDCIKAHAPSIGAMTACLDPTNYVNSVLSLDLDTGAIKWSRQLGGPDTWSFACTSSNPSVVAANCSFGPGFDHDFASQPNLVYTPSFQGVADDRGGRSAGFLLGAGQKSGYYWGINPDNGGLFWSTYVGNGIEWGSSVNIADKNAIFFAINNHSHVYDSVTSKSGVTTKTNGGSWGSVDVSTGKINWQIPTVGKDITDSRVGGTAQGATGFFNRVVFAGSSSGYFAALDAYSGNVLWSYNSGQWVVSGPSFYNETMYWGTGFRTVGTGKPTLFAFSVPAP